jgi:hypothetical protein
MYNQGLLEKDIAGGAGASGSPGFTNEYLP